MKTMILLATAALMASATLASADQEARRAAMKEIGKSAKAISQGMDVQANAATIAEKSGMIPALFEANEITGDSEAKPAIWENWADFTAKGEALHMAAQKLVDTAAAGGDVKAAAGEMMGTCKACHQNYKS